MNETVLENNKKASETNHCRECGSMTLVWKDNWKVCSKCNAVYGKKNVISNYNIESSTKDETTPSEPSNDQDQSFYSNNKGLMILIPILFLGAFLYTTF